MGSTSLATWTGAAQLGIVSVAFPSRLTGLTIAGWFRFTSAAYQAFLSPYNSAAPTASTDVIAVDGNVVIYYGPDFPSSTVPYAPALDWVYCAVSYEQGASPGIVNTRVRAIAGTVGSLAIVGDVGGDRTALQSSWDTDGVIFLNDGFVEPTLAGAEIAYFRVWPDPLTDNADLLAEAASEVAVLPSWADWPLQNGNLSDISGNGRTIGLSGPGTLGAGLTSPPVNPPSPTTQDVSVFLTLV